MVFSVFRTLVVELQLEGVEEVRERHETVDGVVHQNDSTEPEKKEKSFSTLHLVLVSLVLFLNIFL